MGPLSGIKVVEMGVFVAGPAAAAVLGDWGAEVVKIENPAGGDPIRALVSLGLALIEPDVNPALELENRNKRSVAIDVTKPVGLLMVAIFHFIQDTDRPADIVAGYRLRRQDPWFRRLYAFLFGRVLVRAVLGVRVRDLNCAFKLIRRDLVAGLDLKSDGALINAELLGKAQRAGARIVEAGVHHFPRRVGMQTGGNPRVIVRAFRELLALRAEIRAPRAKLGR